MLLVWAGVDVMYVNVYLFIYLCSRFGPALTLCMSIVYLFIYLCSRFGPALTLCLGLFICLFIGADVMYVNCLFIYLPVF